MRSRGKRRPMPGTRAAAALFAVLVALRAPPWGALDAGEPSAAAADGEPAGDDARAAEPEETTSVDAEAILARLRTAEETDRGPLVHELSMAGPSAMEPTRRARDAAEGPLRVSLSRAATWILARRVTSTLIAGFQSQLTFAGQYLDLRAEGPEVIDALFVLVIDASTDGRVRLTACRALADVVDPRLSRMGEAEAFLEGARRVTLLQSLRDAYRDVLLPPFLQEEIGIVLAVLGDTQAVDASLRVLQKQAASDDLNESTAAHVELSSLCYRIRDYERALKSYDAVLSVYERVLAFQTQRGAARDVIDRVRRELSLHYYNAACSSTLSGDIERARGLLRKAVRLDKVHVDNVEKDGDLLRLRQAPDHAKFVEDLRALGR